MRSICLGSGHSHWLSIARGQGWLYVSTLTSIRLAPVRFRVLHSLLPTDDACSSSSLSTTVIKFSIFSDPTRKLSVLTEVWHKTRCALKRKCLSLEKKQRWIAFARIWALATIFFMCHTHSISVLCTIIMVHKVLKFNCIGLWSCLDRYSEPCPRATGCGHCPGTCDGGLAR